MATELIGIELQLRGEEGVYNDLRKLDSLLRTFNGRKVINLELGKSKQRLLELKGEMNDVRREMDRSVKGGQQYKALQGYLQKLKHEYRDVTMRVNELTAALRSQQSFGEMYKSISTNLRHAGQNLQTLGNTLTKIGTPMRRLLNGTVFAAGYRLLGLMTEGFSSATKRADILSTYKPVFKAMGAGLDTTTDAWETQLSTAYDKVYNSVVGLPTGIDEIVNEWKLLTIATQDYSKAADLAIAANNAILASGADENAQTTARRELRTLMTTGKLTERQWDSLRKGIPVAWNAIEQDLKKNGEIQGSLLQALKTGEVTAEEFGDLLIEEGINGKTKEVVNEMLHTYEAATANIKNAFSNMGKNILGVLDEILKEATGKDTIDYLIGMKSVIGSFSEGVQNWLRDNKDAVLDFLNAIKNFDYKSFFEGVGNGLRDALEAFTEVLSFFGNKGMLDELGYFVTIAGPLGRAITLLGGTLKGLSGPLALFLVLTRRAGMRAGAGGLAGGLAGELIGDGTAAGTAAASASKMGKFTSGLSAVFKGWAEIAAMVVGTAGVAWASAKLIKDTIKTIGEIGDEVRKVDWDAAVPALKGFGIFMGAFLSLGSALGTAGSVAMKPAAIGTAVLGGLTAMVAGFADLDMFLIKRTLKNLSKATEYLNQAVDNLNNLDAIGEVGTAKNRIKNAIITFNQIKSLFRGTWDAQRGEWSGGLDKFPKSIRKSVENISETIGNMKTAIIDLNELAGMELDTSAVEEIAPDLTEALSSLRTSILAIPKEWKEDGIVEATSNVSSSIANLKSVFDSMVGDDGILAQISGFIQQSQGYGEGGVYDALITRVQELASALLTVYTSLQGIGAGEYFATNIDNFRAGLKSMKFAIQHLNAIGEMEINDNASANIDAVIEAIKNSFSQDKIEGIKTQVHNFTESIKTALQTIKDIGNEPIEVDAEVKLSSGFYSSVSSVVADINDAADDVRSAWRKIPSTLFKTIYATITAHVDTSGAVSAIEGGMNEVRNLAQNWGASLGNSTGGFISRNGSALYRAKGGSVFKPRGTDTIPAMLTPGEYVHRKQAVDYFGTDFMRRINAMDVRGAMGALLNKASTSIGIGRQSVVNNTVNNNQRVTQNITTNNPAFASMRASRFVGAM